MKKGADATYKDVKSNTPVHFAAKSGAGEALQVSLFSINAQQKLKANLSDPVQGMRNYGSIRSNAKVKLRLD